MSLLPFDSFRLRRSVLRAGIFTAIALSVAGSASAQLPGFTLSNSGPITMVSQQQGPVTVTITPTGGFSGVVSLTCSNLPIYATCNFPNANSGLAIAAGSAGTLSIVVNTSQINDYETRSVPQPHGMSRIAMATLFAPAALLIFLVRRRGLKLGMTARLLLGILVLYPLAGLAGCAAVKPNATPAGSYNFMVTGAAATITASTVVTLKVT